MTIDNKVKVIRDWCKRIEQGKHQTHPTSYITDQLRWLQRFKHIDDDTFNELVDKVIYIIQTYKPD